jgi:histidinol-phosphate/aromatic aminotransferase/cobyric acid decarboxylase-like protein
VVLRSLTKAYSCGGLRVGYALASDVIAHRVRELVPPVQVNELAFRAVLAILASADPFVRLRARVRQNKSIMVSMLTALGLRVIEGHAELPWVLVSYPYGPTSRWLLDSGIRGLRLAPSPLSRGVFADLVHLTVPLSDDRMAELERRLGVERIPIGS